MPILLGETSHLTEIIDGSC